jgi:hypothetical protein
MTIRDAFMVFADDAPAASIDLTQGASPLTYALPAAASNAKVLDLQTSQDWGRGRPLTAHHHIKTSFGGVTVATNTLRLVVLALNITPADPVVGPTNAEIATAVAAVGLADQTAAGNQNGAVLCKGAARATSSLIAGSHEQLIIPPLSSLAYLALTADGKGRRYLAVAFEILSPGGNTDWNAGVFSVWVDGESVDGENVKYASGYSV